MKDVENWVAKAMVLKARGRNNTLHDINQAAEYLEQAARVMLDISATMKPVGYVGDHIVKCLSMGLSGVMTVSSEQNAVYKTPIYLGATAE